MKKIILICTLLMLVAFTNDEGAADWTADLNGRWISGYTDQYVGPYGRTWRLPGDIYEVRVTGNRIEILIVAFGIKNINGQNTRSTEDFLYFRGTIEGHRTAGTFYSWKHSGKVSDRLRVTESYPATKTIFLEGNKLYLGDQEFTRT